MSQHPSSTGSSASDAENVEQMFAHTLVISGFRSSCGNCGARYLGEENDLSCDDCGAVFTTSVFAKYIGGGERRVAEDFRPGLRFIGVGDGCVRFENIVFDPTAA